MNFNKIVLVLVISLLFLGLATEDVRAIGKDVEVWPDCGVYTVSSFPYSHDNLTVISGERISREVTSFKVSALVDSATKVNSYNGWEIVQIVVNGIKIDYPDGTTSASVNFPDSVKVQKDCSTEKKTKCKPTGTFVYTLLGNYPCNLVTGDHPIPARFLNPDYVGQLCSLPGVQYNWNGNWVKHEVRECDGYLKGGNHFDTSQE